MKTSLILSLGLIASSFAGCVHEEGPGEKFGRSIDEIAQTMHSMDTTSDKSDYREQDLLRREQLVRDRERELDRREDDLARRERVLNERAQDIPR